MKAGFYMLRYLEIKQQLQNMVASMDPGEKLMDRCSLCRILETTRTTLDKAIKELVDQEILVSRKGSGTYVAGALEGSVSGEENWCVIVPNISESIYSVLVSGIESIAQERNANVILCNSNNDSDTQDKFIRRLLVSGVSGFIIVPVVTSNPADNLNLYNNLIRSKVPFIFCNRSVDGITAPVVTSNDYYGGYIATKHLIEKGYRKIAYIARHKYSTSMDRCQGYMSALLESSIEINRRLIVMPSYAEYHIDCYEAAKQMIEQYDIDAVVCFNDTVAVDVARAVTACGKRISDDIGIIGYDNTELSRAFSPPLSSVSYQIYDVGKKAADVLANLCRGKKQSSEFDYYLYQPEIIPRQSCKGKTE
ncbi:MAG: hypothetical protein CW338_01480 [Clostridiales bacterium]|nr:hypothetical protein [Clostridiales bacterium]